MLAEKGPLVFPSKSSKDIIAFAPHAGGKGGRLPPCGQVGSCHAQWLQRCNLWRPFDALGGNSKFLPVPLGNLDLGEDVPGSSHFLESRHER